jgi:LacI family transcriptional regulator, galactose operon repressor
MGRQESILAEAVMVEPRSSRVTLRDVAERAGVSTTTASFVLSGRRDMRISAATEERVLQAARLLDYRRRLVPRAEMPIAAPAIGVISDVVATESFAGEMLRGCIAAAADRGHVVLMVDSEGADELEASGVRALLAHGVEKFVYATMGTIVYSVPEPLRGRRVVLLNNVDPTLDVPAVIPDDRRAGRLAVGALVEAGHTDGIWVVGTAGPHPEGQAGGRRLAGIRAALGAAGLRVAGHIRCPWWPEATRAAVAEMLAGGWWERDRPTAVIAMNDRVAMGVYQAVHAAGRRVPDDLSVISFDNSDLARWLDPALSSLTLPYFDLGRRAVELLLTDGVAPGVRKVPMTLRLRASVAACCVVALDRS